jgi:hypothetical protein
LDRAQPIPTSPQPSTLDDLYTNERSATGNAVPGSTSHPGSGPNLAHAANVLTRTVTEGDDPYRRPFPGPAGSSDCSTAQHESHMLCTRASSLSRKQNLWGPSSKDTSALSHAHASPSGLTQRSIDISTARQGSATSQKRIVQSVFPGVHFLPSEDPLSSVDYGSLSTSLGDRGVYRIGSSEEGLSPATVEAASAGPSSTHILFQNMQA